MNSLTKCFLTVLFSSLLSSCGGGGGGTESPSDTSIFNINNLGAEYLSSGIRFIHAVTDGSPMQLVQNEQVVAAPLKYTFTNYLKLSSNTYDIQVYKTNEPKASESVTFDTSKRATVLFCGNRAKQNLQSKTLQHEDAENGTVKIRGVHALFGADSLKFIINGTTVKSSFCNSSDYVEISSDNVSINVYRIVDNSEIASLTLPVSANNAYSLVLIGNINDDYSVKLLRD